MKNKKNIYNSLSVNFLNIGDINILKKAYSYGDKTVGLLAEKSIFLIKKIINLVKND
tara:strand:+ start:98 stop:268 length:171 start_codon:yes stop_codon:yes gene_type:complete